MQVLQSPQSYQPVADLPPTVVVAYTPIVAYTSNRSELLTSRDCWPISTTILTQTTETPVLSEYRLITLGKQLATKLAEILDQLKVHNEEAVYPIMSILEPYMETTEELDFSFPPKSSREVIIEITRRGKVEPTIYFDDSL